MGKSLPLSIASTLVKGRKYKLALVGLQFAYLGYQVLKKRRKKRTAADRSVSKSK
ncbi:hypothetical protein [Zeaxanthinibacter enoshimensis]|uniref:Uncharacterized protein n=1 Tax=Zeaxanthinibacter enoshimensis TaxID=392009 RepID=A0A4R6TGB1_9FLAO|nr:hypothetical protein [Zeaxanthinibacter enoshimensis]TDQ29078.1 hypothetical protein CLV82_2528 [Zeaxanthinibacter enoshimensis]